MPIPIVAGNWKMNTSLAEGVRLASQVAANVGVPAGIEVVVCPPFVSLAAVAQALQGTGIEVGAQNMLSEERGAFTGEVAPGMLAGLCRYVILGHSERRALFGETDDIVNRKVAAAVAAGLIPILCVGETLAQREEGRASDVISQQLRGGLAGLHNVPDLVVAYEPVWAIGTGQAATPEIAHEIMGGVIQPVLAELLGGSVAQDTPLLYGGSVNPTNIESFAQQSSVSGALVGGASLDASQFADIVRLTASAKGVG
jgi:triosephosphate isomerase